MRRASHGRSKEARKLVHGHTAVKDRMCLECGLPPELVPFNMTLYHIALHCPPQGPERQATPQVKELLALMAAGEGESIFFSGIATNKLPMLQEMNHICAHDSSHILTQWVSFFFSEKS